MKKTLLLLFVCTVSTQLIAQKTNSPKAETKAQPAVAENDLVPPPPPPAIEKVKFTPPVIVNDKGYQVSVHYNNGKNMVYMKKKRGDPEGIHGQMDGKQILLRK